MIKTNRPPIRMANAEIQIANVEVVAIRENDDDHRIDDESLPPWTEVLIDRLPSMRDRLTDARFGQLRRCGWMRFGFRDDVWAWWCALHWTQRQSIEDLSGAIDRCEREIRSSPRVGFAKELVGMNQGDGFREIKVHFGKNFI